MVTGGSKREWEKELCSQNKKNKKGTHHMSSRHTGDSISVHQETEEETGENIKNDFSAGKISQDRVESLGLVLLNNFGRL